MVSPPTAFSCFAFAHVPESVTPFADTSEKMWCLLIVKVPGPGSRQFRGCRCPLDAREGRRCPKSRSSEDDGDASAEEWDPMPSHLGTSSLGALCPMSDSIADGCSLAEPLISSPWCDLPLQTVAGRPYSDRSAFRADGASSILVGRSLQNRSPWPVSLRSRLLRPPLHLADIPWNASQLGIFRADL